MPLLLWLPRKSVAKLRAVLHLRCIKKNSDVCCWAEKNYSPLEERGKKMTFKHASVCRPFARSRWNTKREGETKRVWQRFVSITETPWHISSFRLDSIKSSSSNDPAPIASNWLHFHFIQVDGQFTKASLFCVFNLPPPFQLVFLFKLSYCIVSYRTRNLL